MSYPLPPPSRLHILIVDDDDSVREALSLALSGAYVVHAVATGAAALGVLRAHRVAAIVLDEVLQGEHGLDLIGQFRVLSKAPILILTAYGSEDLVVRALRARVDDYLKKPVSIATLQTALDRMMTREGALSDPVPQARRQIDQSLGKGFRPRELATQFGLSEAHLRRLFRATYGKTPRRYLVEARMQRAAELLRTTRLGIKQIAQEVGYSRLVTFDRNFKRILKMMPSAYRQASRKSVQK